MRPTTVSEEVRLDIDRFRERLLAVHYFEEAHWLVAAVAFPGLCGKPAAQAALRRAASIAWQFGFPSVSHWLNRDFLLAVPEAPGAAEDAERNLRLPPLADPL
jgi:hypothetical protein